MQNPQQFNDALARLDADIEAAERVLVELKLKREGANAFLEYLGMSGEIAGARSSARSKSTASDSGGSPTELVSAAVQRMNKDTYTLDEVVNGVEAAGGKITKDQVRNSVHYLVRRKKMKNLRRGLWTTTDAEAPAATGASDGNTPTSEEGGGSHEPEASEAPPSQAEDLDDPQLGTSMTEVIPR